MANICSALRMDIDALKLSQAVKRVEPSFDYEIALRQLDAEFPTEPQAFDKYLDELLLF